MAFLSIEGLQVNYGSVRALKGISLQVEKGSIVTLIGANGAGKTTTMKAIAGLLHCSAGHITFDGNEITNRPSDFIVRSGIILAPEGRQVFPRMTVTENLNLGAFTVRSKPTVREAMATVFELFPILKERERQYAGTLSGGEQQMLAVGRALMGQPKLLMLDEPSLGLAPLVIREIFALIRRINKMGTTILLVEQNARMALQVSDYAYVIETGQMRLAGAGCELMTNERIMEAYLGGL